MPAFLKQGGRFGVGSDSLVRISAADELRTLEYGQRLFHRQRNVLGDSSLSTGRLLFDGALDGKALAVGQPADFVVLDTGGHRDDAVLDSWIFATDNNAVRSVYRGGVPVVQLGRHKDRDTIAARYAKVMTKLTG
jgi:formimidoylglutamate deiminase